MAERRTFSVITLSVDSEAEILGYLGFRDTETTEAADGSTTCEITHGGYRAEALSTGDGHIVAQIGPVVPKSMTGIRSDFSIEFRNGHSLATEGITIDPPEKWVITNVTIGKDSYKYPDADTLNTAARAFRDSIMALRDNKADYQRARKMAANANRRPRPV